jgi:hypothetical protein
MQQVRELARLCGFLCYHTHDSRRSVPGLPDLCMVEKNGGDQPSRLIFAELKSDKGRLTAAQSEWLQALGQVPHVEVYCWRPADWDEIVDVLRRA